MGNIPLRLILLLSVIQPIFAQSASAIFLLIPPSPTMNGLGGIGTVLPSDDPYAGYYNPANGLDHSEGVSYSHSKLSTPWLQNLSNDIVSEYEVWNLGIIPERYPINLVASFHKTYLDLGEQVRTDVEGQHIGTFSSYMKSDAVSLGMGYRGNVWRVPIDISIGYTWKTVTQKLGPPNIVSGYSNKSVDKMSDYGLLLSIPIAINSIAFKKLDPLNDAFDIRIMPSFGYSVSNIGDNINFTYNSDWADPTPKYLRTGISSTIVLSYKSRWDLLEWRGGRAASDMLVVPRYSSDESIKYQSGFGDVGFMENVVRSKTDSSLTIHRGDEWTFLDLYTVRRGRKIDIDGRINLKTSGYGYRSDGVFKILYFLTRDPIFEAIPKIINIQYNYSEWEEERGHPLENTEFESLSITFNNLDLLIKALFE